MTGFWCQSIRQLTRPCYVIQEPIATIFVHNITYLKFNDVVQYDTLFIQVLYLDECNIPTIKHVYDVGLYGG